MSKQIGAFPRPEGIQFRLWAPHHEKVSVQLLDEQAKVIQEVPLQKNNNYYHEALIPNLKAGQLYFYNADGSGKPDPASRHQPRGPLGPSAVVHDEFKWTDQTWKGLPLEELVIYELHVGTATEEGTFEALKKIVPHLKSLGINALQLMPIAQFSGQRNWGYDGVGLFAPQNSYAKTASSPESLKGLIDYCHSQGLAVFLDVVYNHLGPEGNFLSYWGPYFQDKYKTPWGEALNFDGEYSDEVRNFFLQNAKQWLKEFHFDGLRLDAIHAIMDSSAPYFLEQLVSVKNEIANETKRTLHLIAECEIHNPQYLRPANQYGMGLSAQWMDDFHHCLHTLLTGEKQSYYEDFGSMESLATAFKRGLVFEGQYSPHKKRRHGQSYNGISRSQFVLCSQNHDQVGNRKDGDRLVSLVGIEGQKLAAACVFLSGGLPLLFAGEEFAATSPFQYFVSHENPELCQLVSQGRKKEFSGFAWSGEVPDPADAATFLRSKLDWKEAATPAAQDLLGHYKKLIKISKWLRTKKIFEKAEVQTDIDETRKTLSVFVQTKDLKLRYLLNFNQQESPNTAPNVAGHYKPLYSTHQNCSLQGPLPPLSASAWIDSSEEVI